jgi:hypothetical protein
MSDKHIQIETRSILIDKLMQDYQLHSAEISEAVELYYDAQKLRIMHSNKEFSEGESQLGSWFALWLELGEKLIIRKLTKWVLSDDSPSEAKWAYDQYGIGPVLAAGLSAHIKPEKADSVSAVWKFAGLAPGFDHKVKGQALPYNARLKVLCWKIGESFVKVSGKEEAVYGQLYVQFKKEEVQKNDTGRYKEAAERELANKKFSDNATKKRLLEGKLSDGHLHSRAKRRAVKLFLSHYYMKGRESRGLPVREPYAIAIQGHDGLIEPKS